MTDFGERWLFFYQLLFDLTAGYALWIGIAFWSCVLTYRLLSRRSK